jgi:predicted RNase H-like HicB family nuclease
MRYAVVFEKTATGYSAYAPDVLGCIASGATLEAARESMHEALKFHLDGLREDGEMPPEATAVVNYIYIEIEL